MSGLWSTNNYSSDIINMNILVTGANGQLGQAIRAQSHRHQNHNIVFTDVISDDMLETILLDITSEDAIRSVCKSAQINVIINCAAYTDVEKAETDFEMANLINCDAVRNLATVAKECDITLIHISTDYVYDSRKAAPYVETDEKYPVNVYASTKYAGEVAIHEVGCKFILFRTAWMFSGFGSNFMKTMLRLTAEKETLNVVYDQVGTPTYAPELVSIIFKVIDEDKLDMTGEYNFTNEGSVSWYDFAVAINYLSGHNCKINPCSSEEYGSKVIRPNYSVLDKSKVKKTFGITIPHWLISLEQCINNKQ